MRPIFVVNELTLLPFLVAAARGRAPEYLLVDPLLPALGGLLARAVRWAEGRGATRLIERFPQHREAWDYPVLIFGHDVLARTEAWQRSAYRFKETADADGGYGIAFKLLVTMFLFRRYMAAFLLVQALKEAPHTPVHGLSPALHGLATAWFGPDALAAARPMGVPHRLANLPALLLALSAGLAFVLRRTRTKVEQEEAYLMADFNNDWREFPMYEAVSRVGRVLLLMRNAEIKANAEPGAAAYPQLLPGEGLFAPADALAAAFMVTGDALSIYARYGWVEPALFWQVALLPYRRATMRALFNRVRPRFFWARDEYNVEHAIRRQEVNRVGGRQHGLNHAVQGITILMPQLRYVSMDVYYTMGRAFHPAFRDTWSVGTLRPVGAFAFDAAYLSKPRRTTTAILFMARFAIGNAAFIKAFRAAAQAFPDRPVWLQVKAGYPHDTVTPAFVAACLEGLPNASFVTTPVYDLVLEADMIVSDASTIIAEVVQLNTPVVMLDVVEPHMVSIFRQFPGLCVRTAEETVGQLKRWVSGEEVFRREAFAELIEPTDEPIWGLVCADMGLPGPAPKGD